jgi:hypothetical protein
MIDRMRSSVIPAVISSRITVSSSLLGSKPAPNR